MQFFGIFLECIYRSERKCKDRLCIRGNTYMVFIFWFILVFEESIFKRQKSSNSQQRI